MGMAVLHALVEGMRLEDGWMLGAMKIDARCAMLGWLSCG